MTAEIIPFPSVIERVARRMLPVMDAPPGDQRDEVFCRTTTELGVGLDDGLNLSAEQWTAVWHRVNEMMSDRKSASG